MPGATLSSITGSITGGKPFVSMVSTVWVMMGCGIEGQYCVFTFLTSSALLVACLDMANSVAEASFLLLLEAIMLQV